MNAYEQKQAARQARFEELAAKASNESNRTYRQARTMGEAIPFGQPILVGHHSEGRDRNYRARIHNTFGKAFALSDKADYYAQKAASVGTAGISSDDPEAVAKLRAQLAGLEHSQAMMKAANKAIRDNKTPEARIAALVAVGFNEAQAGKLLEKDFAGRIGFASYSLQNNNANIRRIEARIKQLEAMASREDKEEEGTGYTYREDTEENRVMFIFKGKPSEKIRSILKSNGFKWSPSRGAWVRMLNQAGINTAVWVKREFAAIPAGEFA